MRLKGLFSSIFATTGTASNEAEVVPSTAEHVHQRTRRRSSVTMYIAHSQLQKIVSEDNDPYYKVQELGKNIVLTSASVVSSLFYDILVPEKLEMLIVPLLEGLVESKKDSHSLAVLSEVLFDFMVTMGKLHPELNRDVQRIGMTLAETLRRRIETESGETKEAIASAKEHILPKLVEYMQSKI